MRLQFFGCILHLATAATSATAQQAPAFAPAPLTVTGLPTGRALGGWLLDPGGQGVPRMLGSTWNGSFGVAVDSASGLVVAIASNIELDQPAQLIARVLELWRPLVARLGP